MSFDQLKNARNTKIAGKSYVTASSSRTDGPPTSSLPKAESSATKTPSNITNEPKPVEKVDLYSELPSGLQIRTSADAGRGIWANTVQKKGQVVCSITPHITAISTNYLAAHCSTCCRPSASEDSLKRCTRCRAIYYCSTACRDTDWSMHKLECRALQTWAKEAPSADVAVPSDAIRSIARLLWLKQKHGFNSVWAREVDALQSNRKLLQPSSAESHMYLAHSLVRYLGLSSPAELAPFGIDSPGDLVDLLSRFSVNTITLSTSSLTPIGLVVSPLVALFNHSCDPNAVVVFPHHQQTHNNPPLAQIIAIRDIVPGEEITTTYIDTTLPTALRQASLQETYNFACQCSLCSAAPSADPDPRESVRCPKSCGGRCQCPTEDNLLSRCNKCKAIVPFGDSIADAIRVAQDGLAKATTLQSRDPAHALRLTTNLISLLSSAGLMAGAHPLLALTRLHLSLLLSSLPSPPDSSSLDEAIRTAARVASGLEEVLREGHPVRGLARAELGKLLAVDEPSAEATTSPQAVGAEVFPPRGSARLALAYGTLQRAYAELSIGFGPGGGEVGRDVRETLLNLEKEIGVWKEGIKSVTEYGEPIRR